LGKTGPEKKRTKTARVEEKSTNVKKGQAERAINGLYRQPLRTKAEIDD